MTSWFWVYISDIITYFVSRHSSEFYLRKKIPDPLNLRNYKKILNTLTYVMNL